MIDQNTAKQQPVPAQSTSAITVGTTTQQITSGFKAIDTELTADDLQIAQDYVTETRADFQLYPHPTWTRDRIDGFLQLLQDTLQRLRSFEVDNTEAVYPWKDKETEISADVILRDEDPKEFDTITKNYELAKQYFDRYFEDHIALLRAHPDLTEGNPIIV